MKVRLKPNLLVVTGESTHETEDLVSWARRMDGQVFAMKLQDEQTFRLTALGPRPEACREPINITSRSPEPSHRLISNFAHTPFVLDEERYESVEGFWQGLKFPEPTRRREIAQLHGGSARRASDDAPEAVTVEYQGREIRVGTYDHWQLMKAACWAKFEQHAEARQALLATAPRPLEHRVRRDSRTIPGVIMADLWMHIRRQLLERGE